MRIIFPIIFTLILGIISADAQEFYQLQNRWKQSEFIHVQEPSPAVGTIQPGWWSAQWILEPVEGYYRIKNRWRNEFLHIQNGSIESGNVEAGWWSAQWALEPVAGTSFYRIRNRWKPEVALHNQNGSLEAGAIELGWWSAHWATVSVTSDGVVQQVPATTTVSARNGDNPSAFTPEHNGKIEQASVRYTDQISLSGKITVGSKIYFFPQEVIANTDGLSFDPKNPPIGGQTFTVIEVTPEVKFDRPMPMMRNRGNDSFSFVIEVF